jgi:isopenicillin-N N-acyltransferase-like protein
MNRREFLKLIPLAAAAQSLSGCIAYRYLTLDLNHVLLRSDVIDSFEKEREIVSKAKLTTTADGRIRVLFTRGNAYERGYQQGYLLRKEVHDNMGYLWDRALSKFKSEELFAEAFERMRPFMSKDIVDEMHGLAHGSGLPLATVHYIHVLADIGEWGGKKRLGQILKQMLHGELATTCSNLSATKTATVDGKMYTVRILDWGLHKISRLHKYPLITVNVPETGIPSANIGWVGYLGAVSGMNAEGITLGEMGYRNPPNETLNGEPMPFMLRRVMTEAKDLSEVRGVINNAVGTCSYVFLMSDGKTGEAELYVKDRERFLVFKPGEHLKDDKEDIPAIADLVYGGRYNDIMTSRLNETHGKISPKLLMDELIPKFAMPSNFQNVIYDPAGLKFWVSNAASKDEWAASQPYSEFELGKELKKFLSNS